MHVCGKTMDGECRIAKLGDDMLRVEYLPVVIEQDIPALSSPAKKRIAKAIAQKLTTNPIEFGKPLRYSLRGARSLRVGDYRVIFEIAETSVLIIHIGHRRDVYK